MLDHYIYNILTTGLFMTHHSSVPQGDYPMFRFIKQFIKPEKKILDIGCGNASFISLFIISKEKYVGIEKDKEKCAEAKKKGYPVLCADIELLSPQEIHSRFDVILAKDIIEHCSKPEQIMQYIHTHLNTTGSVFISVPSELSLLIWDDYTHQRGFSQRALSELLEDTGFKLIRFEKDHSLINFKAAPSRYLSLLLFKKITKLDFITQGYLIHAKKK